MSFKQATVVAGVCFATLLNAALLVANISVKANAEVA